MNFLYKFIKPLIVFILSIILIPLILTILNMFKLYTNKTMILIIGSLLMLIVGFLIGRKSNSKGYLNGLLISVISIFIIFILTLVFKLKININTLIYYSIMIISSIMGSMIGINKKTKKAFK